MQAIALLLNRPAGPFTCLHIVHRSLSAQKLVANTSSSSNTKTTASGRNNEKLVKVAIVGVPNAGKSTFINNLLNHRVRTIRIAFKSQLTAELSSG